MFNMTGIRTTFSLLVAVMLSVVFAQSGSVIDPDCPVKSAALMGRTVDNDTGEPVGFVNILLEEANRSITSNAEGYFSLTHMRCGQFNLRSFRIGYENVTMPVTLEHNDTTRLVIRLPEATLMMRDVTVEASRDGSTSSLHQAPILVTDKKLHQNLGKTIAETVDYEPGISQQSMGPAAARPVMRGLGGDRLLLLEDSETTGDLSATSSDHAVVIEPMTAERIEVIRGPEALIYGSNALAGVINVVRGYIPTSRIDKVTGSISLQNETVNEGVSGGGEIRLPAGPFTVRLDGSSRRAQNLQTPTSPLLNSFIKTDNASAGLGYVQKWGLVGIAFGYYRSDYGIPPNPFGSHASGVDINLDRYHAEAKFEYHPHHHWLRNIKLHYTWSRYYHEEIEPAGYVGIKFGVISHQLKGQFNLGDMGVFGNGRMGFKAGYRDYASGALTFTPASKEYSGAVYYYQEARMGPFLGHASLRYDHHSILPETSRMSNTVGYIRDRVFQNVSGSVSLHYVWQDWVFGNTITRTFRAPGIEELFSEGPHSAVYAYEVGNADLDAETGLGLEVFANYQGAAGNLYLAVFQNQINNYLFPVNTGQKSWRRADLDLYRYAGENVLMRGAEMSMDQHIWGPVSIAGTVSYVWAELTDQHSPVPRIPPLEGKVGVRYHRNNMTLGATVRAADNQDRTGEFETATDGYMTMDVHIQYTWSGGPFLHSISASLQNAGDTEYRKHLNRVKDYRPEPGRNFKVLYKVFF